MSKGKLTSAQEDLLYVEDTLRGNQKAFEKLLSKYYNSIYYMILKLVHNNSDAEELSNETFMKAYSNLKQYSSRYAFSTWIFRISTNLSIDFLRKKKGNLISIDEEMKLAQNYSIRRNLEADTLNPEEGLIRQQDAKHVHKQLEELEDKYKKLIKLRYFEEYTYEEISKELNIPIGTVKTQLHRAKALLIKGLKL